MLIDLSRFTPVTIDPGQYTRTLAVRVDAPDDKPMCGVFAGRHQDIPEGCEGKLLPQIAATETGDDMKTFVIDQPDEGKQPIHVIRRWTYVAIGWENGVYVEHPYVYKLTLEDHNNGPGNHLWVVSVVPASSLTGLKIVLHDYEPGLLASRNAAE